MSSKPCILISSCLIGIYCRYDGKTTSSERLVDLVREGKAIFICPEQIGGLATPRVPAEIEHGKTAKDVLEGRAKVVGDDGSDVTREFVNGANETLKLCKRLGIKIAILREKSPSCGSSKVFDGTFLGNKISGHGITTELLINNGITVYSEENFPADL